MVFMTNYYKPSAFDSWTMPLWKILVFFEKQLQLNHWILIETFNPKRATLSSKAQCLSTSAIYLTIGQERGEYVFSLPLSLHE